ncbi:hypothetical protein [Xanthomonas theicola]|uniref:Uncharacterized protein n=1 Tax=Xanthomonas theicola TaxID=56464 RepID=A0A2S6ZCG2_9XANT|nr:hypothetical protein [Xanthomonas theicola]PPT87767.1 hypothetical protein XthCFBP4691_15090 [Xanthomonas theicola]QNH26574.1 hypothetical protein G4Q83_20180 [Xanthomonas theicola]
MKRPLSSKARIALALLWLALLTVAGVWLGNALQVSGDLRKFMPARGSRRRFASPDAARAAPGKNVLALAWSQR